MSVRSVIFVIIIVQGITIVIMTSLTLNGGIYAELFSVVTSERCLYMYLYKYIELPHE